MAASEKTAPAKPKAAAPALTASGGGVLVPLTPISTLQPIYWQADNSVTGGTQIRGLPGLPIVQETSEFIVTPAQLHALKTNPLQIVPRPGLGFGIFPTFFNFIFSFVAPQYVITGSDPNLYIGWGDTLAKIQNATALGLDPESLIGASDSVIRIDPCNVNTPVLLNVVDNQPLSLGCGDDVSAGGGHLHFIVEYAIINVKL